jgi:hypothetical protein
MSLDEGERAIQSSGGAETKAAALQDSIPQPMGYLPDSFQTFFKEPNPEGGLY